MPITYTQMKAHKPELKDPRRSPAPFGNGEVTQGMFFEQLYTLEEQPRRESKDFHPNNHGNLSVRKEEIPKEDIYSELLKKSAQNPPQIIYQFDPFYIETEAYTGSLIHNARMALVISGYILNWRLEFMGRPHEINWLHKRNSSQVVNPSGEEAMVYEFCHQFDREPHLTFMVQDIQSSEEEKKLEHGVIIIWWTA